MLNFRFAFLYFLLFLLTGALYSLGLPGDFLFDDWPNLLHNDNVKITTLNASSLVQAAASGVTGGTARPLSMLTFGINHAITGFSPSPLKSVNIVIHLMNGLLIAWLTTQVAREIPCAKQYPAQKLKSKWIALFCTAFWVLHPLHVSTVLYSIQRMTLLSTLFLLAALCFYCYGRTRQAQGESGLLSISLSLSALPLLAFLCKENGALAIPLIMLIEIAIFRFRWISARNYKALKFAFFAIAILPFAAILWKYTNDPGWLNNLYAGRDFTASERLMTQSRVVWTYLSWIIKPELADYYFYHDDIAVSKSVINPPETTIAILGLLALSIFSAKIFFSPSAASFGAAFFLVAHSLESTLIPLELAFEHRNYLPMFGVALAVCGILIELSTKINRYHLIYTISTLFFFTLACLTWNRCTIWGNPARFDILAAENHPNSIRANVGAGRQFTAIAVNNSSLVQRDVLLSKGTYYCQRAAEVSPQDVEGLFCLIIIQNIGGMVDSGTLKDLIQRLQSHPISHTELTWISLVSRYWRQPEFSVPHTSYAEIINATLSNPRVEGRTRANINTQASGYAANAMRNKEAAIFFSSSAVEQFPKDAQYRLNLAKIYRYFGEFESANKALMIARQHAKHQSMKTAIEEEQRQLDQARTGFPGLSGHFDEIDAIARGKKEVEPQQCPRCPRNPGTPVRTRAT